MAVDLTNEFSRNLIQRIKDISGQNPGLCMQCGTCSASCTGRKVMDYLPRRVTRMIQMGKAEVLDCKSIWTCSTCLICTARCPRGIDIARLMEALRVINLRLGKEVLDAKKVQPELLAQVPQMALVSGFRKMSS